MNGDWWESEYLHPLLGLQERLVAKHGGNFQTSDGVLTVGLELQIFDHIHEVSASWHSSWVPAK